METDGATKAALIEKITELRERQKAILVEKELIEHELLSESTKGRIRDLLKTTQEIERNLEAEGEFISIYLKGRVDRLKKDVLELRSQLAEKGREVAKSFAEMSPEQIVKCKIESNRKTVEHAKQRMSETFKEIELLTAKAQRLQGIIENLDQKGSAGKSDGHKSPIVSFPRNRRASTFAVPKVLEMQSEPIE